MKERGYIGMFGALLTLIGVFVPFVEVWFFDYSLAEFLQDFDRTWLLILIIAAVVFAFVAFALSWNSSQVIGGIILFATLIVYGYLFSQLDEEVGISFSSALKYMKSGFWLILVGEIIMLFSSEGNNKKIASLFRKGNTSESLNKTPANEDQARWNERMENIKRVEKEQSEKKQRIAAEQKLTEVKTKVIRERMTKMDRLSKNQVFTNVLELTKTNIGSIIEGQKTDTASQNRYLLYIDIQKDNIAISHDFFKDEKEKKESVKRIFFKEIGMDNLDYELGLAFCAELAKELRQHYESSNQVRISDSGALTQNKWELNSKQEVVESSEYREKVNAWWDQLDSKQTVAIEILNSQAKEILNSQAKLMEW